MQPEVEAAEPIKGKSFLDRQFSDEGSPSQTVFDVLFGILAPILALAFDPILFRADESCAGQPFLGRFTLFAYFAIALGILTFAIWLVAGRGLQPVAAFFAGVLFAGAFFAGIIGIGLFPLSVIGLLAIIGVFGFTPLITAVVYLRNARRAAVHAADNATGTLKLIMTFVAMGFAALLVLGIPALAQWRAMTVIDEAAQTLVSNPSEAEQDQAIKNLKQFNNLCLGACRSMLYAEFSETWYEGDDYQLRFTILQAAYQEVTGIEIIDCSAV